MNFFSELKRRNVYKVAVAYAVVTWLLIQAASIFLPAFDAPPWVMKIFIVVIIFGFPVALIFSWAFEITPEGIKLESDIDPNKSIKRRTGRKIVAVTIALAVVAASLFVYQVVRSRSTSMPLNNAGAARTEAATAPPNKSIAVLPFESLSEDKANAYFAEGIQEEILARLAKIADLKVISRTSTQKYKSAPPNLREIAQQLGVAHVLEGTVQKAADQVRVNVQLINALTDSHLWAETYDRKLTDIFAVESEIAKGIAVSLQAKLSGREGQALAIKPTNNPEAYDAYLRGLAFETRSHYPSFNRDLLLKAIGSYERAVQLDPDFAIAWARLSLTHAFLSFSRDEPTHATEDEAAKHALNNAQKLAPDSPETLLTLGYYQYWARSDYGAAKMTFERVTKMLPANSEVLQALGRIAQREGHWDQSVAYHEKALALDPRNVGLLMDASWTYCMLRQFPAALKLYDRALDITPNNPDVMAFKAGVYQAQGDLQEAPKLLSQINELMPAETLGIKIDQLRLERNYREAIRLLQARLAQFHFGSESDKAFVEVELALTQRVAGDMTGARVTAEEAYDTIDQIYTIQPDNFFLALLISQALALRGEKDLALKEAQRAIMLSRNAKDAVTGPGPEERLALIQMIVGEKSGAISTLTHLLQTPYSGWTYSTPITPAFLRLDPIWDPLRSDPAFQKLCEEKAK